MQLKSPLGGLLRPNSGILVSSFSRSAFKGLPFGHRPFSRSGRPSHVRVCQSSLTRVPVDGQEQKERRPGSMRFFPLTSESGRP